MRLGKVSFNFYYVVDLDDENMVYHASSAIMEDIENLVKYNELAQCVVIQEDSSLTEDRIPEFLRDDEE